MLAVRLLLALQATSVAPVLDFPEPGLDDPAAYQGYRTRFFRDTRGNAVQVYLDRRSGRVVTLWADAANESAAFTARDTAGAPAALVWGAPRAEIDNAGGRRALTYRLRAPAARLVLGHFVLGSMRWERDIQYQQRHLAPFDSAIPAMPELEELARRLERLDAAERDRHLALLGAPDAASLRARLRPTITATPGDTVWAVRVEQPSFDGRNRIALELRGSTALSRVEATNGRIVVRPLGSRPIVLAVRVETDAAPLTALSRERIFTADFLAFLERAGRAGPAASRFRRLERQVRGVELVSYEEKLMAGLPNFATYFGRDMMMTALMMEPVWQPAMLEHVLGSVLRKVSPGGEVSHEEALGGQAIRENATEYSGVLARADAAAPPLRDSLLARARAVLGDLQAVRENYHMVDDDFQLPVVAGRYFAHPGVSAEAKRRFLLAPARGDNGATRLDVLLRNFAYVAGRAAPYARAPDAVNLVSFPHHPDGGWHPGSWRDSRVGYARGRFAMDVNAIWVPQALGAIATSLAALRGLGFSSDELGRLAQEAGGAALATFVTDSAALTEARARWADAARHFEVAIPADEVRRRLERWLASRAADERRHWQVVADSARIPGDTLRFLALALDDAGRPIPVVNTDPATLLFLSNLDPARATEVIRPVTLPYPAGLLVPALGPLVANDVYAAPAVWQDFHRDQYHSPRVVWGREVNLLQLGLARQIDAAGATSPAGRTLADALRRIRSAVDASGLQHAELWSYRVERGALRPVRYGSSSDVQLWNLTNLAVQFRLAATGTPASPRSRGTSRP